MNQQKSLAKHQNYYSAGQFQLIFGVPPPSNHILQNYPQFVSANHAHSKTPLLDNKNTVQQSHTDHNELNQNYPTPNIDEPQPSANISDASSNSIEEQLFTLQQNYKRAMELISIFNKTYNSMSIKVEKAEQEKIVMKQILENNEKEIANLKQQVASKEAIINNLKKSITFIANNCNQTLSSKIILKKDTHVIDMSSLKHKQEPNEVPQNE